MLFAAFVLLILHHSGLTDGSCPPESGEVLPNAIYTLIDSTSHFWYLPLCGKIKQEYICCTTECVSLRAPSYKLRNYDFREMNCRKMDCTVIWLAVKMLSQALRSCGCIRMATLWTAPRKFTTKMTLVVSMQLIVMVPYSTPLHLSMIGHLCIMVCTHAVSWETALMIAVIGSPFGSLVSLQYY